MCTVSFYCDDEHVIVTSNRDEHINRPLALPPSKIVLKNHTAFCPIDPQHQGTWFVVNHLGNVFVLLNGAEHKHTSQPPYKKSRGLILLEIADSLNCLDFWQETDLDQIEPFTVVAYCNKKLIQLRWDGFEKTKIELDTSQPHIWSSATLYQPEIIKHRRELFFQFLEDHTLALSPSDLLNFHMNTNKDDLQNGLIINRDNMMLTKNITQCVLEKSTFTLNHRDLILNEQTTLSDIIHEK